MKIKTLTAALACALPVTGAFAAALDRSGQSIAPFLQPNNYFEAGVSILDPDVSGKEAGTSETRNNISEMANDYVFANVAFKFQPTENFSFGILYDQPFGASATYSGNNVFVSKTGNTVLPTATLAGLRASTIQSNVNAVLPTQIQNALAANFVPAVNGQITQIAQNAIATGSLNGNAIPTGTPISVVESLIRNNAQAMQQIEAGVTTTITNNVTNAVTNAVTTQVDASLNGVNALLGKGATKVSVDTHAISLIGGFQPNENWNIYGGAVYQEIEGDISLRGQAYSLYNGYDAEISKNGAWGWLAGIAFQIPDIALKASLTYRSEIDHDVNIKETMSSLGALAILPDSFFANSPYSNGATAAAAINVANGSTRITTPQSVNLDLQSGIMADTVAFANIRWVNWKDFAIQPYKFGLVSNVVGNLVGQPNGFDLVSYSDDQWSVTTGVGRKLNDKWAGNVSVGWDSGAGDPVTTLGPTEGYWNVGLGIQYSPAENYFVAGGVKYFWLGDAKAQSGAQAGTDQYVAEFTDNTAIAYGLKLGYRF